MSEETSNRYFDELTSGLASGSLSRRKALRLMGAALIGGALASIPGIVKAAPFTCPPGPAPVECRRATIGPECCTLGQVCCRHPPPPGRGRRIKQCLAPEICFALGGRQTRQ
jgi:hypothetical protein